MSSFLSYGNRKGSLQLQVFSRVLLLILLLIPALGFYRYLRLQNEAKVLAESDRQSVVNVLSVALREPVWSLDYEQINSVVLAQSHVRSLASVELSGIELSGIEMTRKVRRYSRDEQDRLVLGQHEGSAQETVLSTVRFDVMREGEAISQVSLYFSSEPYVQGMRRALIDLLVSLLVTALLFGLLLYYLMRTYVGRPVARLQAAIAGCAQGQGFEVAAELPDNEIKQFAEDYASLFNELRQHQSHLQTLVDSRTRDLNLSNQKLQAEITQRTTTEQDLVRARTQAEQANQAKSQFLAHISHELRTPLNGIIGYTQLLHNKPDLPEDLREYIDNIHRCGEQLLRLINNILDLSKIEANEVERHDEPLSLRLLADDIRAIVSPRAQEKGLSLSVDIAPDVADWVMADGERLRQVLVNLMGNAIKFTPAGSVTLSLRRIEQGRTRFAVSDTGRGIPQADQARIFEAFQQSGEVNRSVGEGGTGLGLAIARRLVVLLGGELKLQSELGQGSCFSFELRLLETRERAVPTARRQILRLAPGYSARILVVDDVFENRHVLSLQLDRVGYTSRMAESGEEALKLLYEFEPQLVLMDVQMPGMDGIEATRRIHKLRPGLPVVAFTASVFDRLKEQSVRSEFQGVLFKPVLIENAYTLLGELLDLRYTYADDPQPPAAAESNGEATDQYARLPPDQREELKAWFEGGSVSKIRDYGKRLTNEAEYSILGAQLYRLAKSYQLESLGRLLGCV